MTSVGNLVNLDLVKSNTIEELTQTATQIALQNFEWRFATFVFFNSTTVWYGVKRFLQSYRKTAIVGRGTFYPKFVDKTSQYVLFGSSIANIIQMLDWMQNHEFDNTGKYIIVCESQGLEDCGETKAVETLWAHKITNVVFLKRTQDKVLGYTYFPLNDSDCRTDLPVEVTNLKSCFAETRYEICRDIFAVKLQNMNNCPLIASTFIQLPYMDIVDGVPIGANGDLLVVLAEGLNASLEVMTPLIGNGWGKLEEDGTWSGSLADVYYDQANISISSAALTLARFSYFHLSVSYHTAGVVWVTHPARMMPSSLKLTRPFQTGVQIAVLMSFMLVVVYALMMKTRLWHVHEKVIGESKPRSSIVFYSWMICMGLPSTKLPSKPLYAYMMFLWMWFCIFIRTFYQVSLMTVLKANYYFGEFETIDDVIEAGYPFGGGAALNDYFLDYPIVHDKWTNVNTNDIIPMLRNVSKGVEFVLAMSMETAHTLISDEKLSVHILPQKIISSPTVIFFKKFSPLAKSVNRILVKLIESGNADKMKQNYCVTVKKNKSEDSLEPINMNHYTSCYLVLIIGWVVSFVFFVGEIIFYRINNQPRKSNPWCGK